MYRRQFVYRSWAIDTYSVTDGNGEDPGPARARYQEKLALELNRSQKENAKTLEESLKIWSNLA